MIQSYIAISQGGIAGVGYGKGMQKAGYLPEAHTDMIISIIAEELGFFGVFFVVIMEFFITLRIFLIGRASPRLFNSLVCYGIGFLIISQTFINIGGATGIIPLTGVTLPFVSYGSNSILFLAAAIGIVLSISAANKIDNGKIKRVK